MAVDKAVRKENKRRNIILDGDIYQVVLFNFTPNLSFNHILEIYGIEGEALKNNSKYYDDYNMNVDIPFDEMSTFPQTYDAGMNINMEISIEDALELRRK